VIADLDALRPVTIPEAPAVTSVQPIRRLAKSPLRPTLMQQLPEIAERLDEKSTGIRTSRFTSQFTGYHRAASELDAGRAEAALARYEGLLKESPNNAAARSGRAAALAAMSRFEESAVAYKNLLAIAPEDANGRYNYGVVLCRLSRFDEAAEQFGEAVGINPRHAKAWFNLASLSQRAARLTDARFAWERFVELEPDNTAALFQLGTVEMDLDAFEDAIFSFTYAMAQEPEDLTAHLNLALAYAAAGDPFAALEIAEEVDLRFPCDPAVADLRYQLGEAFPEIVASSAFSD
jgi:tetratricopeptide (TPR) repeat protein